MVTTSNDSVIVKVAPETNPGSYVGSKELFASFITFIGEVEPHSDDEKHNEHQTTYLDIGL